MDQRLYWSVSRPMRLLGLTLDEWGVLLGGLVPGIILVNGENFMAGISFILGGFSVCYTFKKFKNVSEHFLLKSWLLSKGFILPPSKNYPNLLGKSIGK